MFLQNSYENRSLIQNILRSTIWVEIIKKECYIASKFQEFFKLYLKVYSMSSNKYLSQMENWSKEDLIRELQKREEENIALKNQLQMMKNSENDNNTIPSSVKELNSFAILPKVCSELSKEEVARYSRQLILPELGPSGQKKLVAASVLIVGCGGLGCPSAIYLAAAGVGCLGLIDYDTVEKSNLHRQILHTEKRIGISKASSVGMSVKALNSNVDIIPFDVSLTSETALQIIPKFDLVLDCTDNVATRYLLNDACVIANKPLVSGSALRYEGQLTIYHLGGGPCFRCIHPKPPPPETVTNCSDGGVLGVVPGVIGCLQALEAIKVITGMGSTLSERLLLFDGLQGMFRTVKLRSRKNTCEVCGDEPSITQLIDYEQFCGAKATDKDKGLRVLQKHQRISVMEYKEIVDRKTTHILLDVRLPVELEICSLPNAVNIPLKDIKKLENITTIREMLSSLQTQKIYCLCRRGNDSQLAVSALQEELQGDYDIRDIVGGLTEWSHKIDSTIPIY
ncbi:Molybdenum cofactor synthesis protein 3 [Halocaridina rubra]|uniref:Adenylyltransferase and sulfurtransferase MOCS3 homolog n=1 Tax=Halocaridina rubra TaxID=373956 RepID=A0AAN9ADV8_HALRR